VLMGGLVKVNPNKKGWVFVPEKPVERGGKKSKGGKKVKCTVGVVWSRQKVTNWPHPGTPKSGGGEKTANEKEKSGHVWVTLSPSPRAPRETTDRKRSKPGRGKVFFATGEQEPKKEGGGFSQEGKKKLFHSLGGGSGVHRGDKKPKRKSGFGG